MNNKVKLSSVKLLQNNSLFIFLGILSVLPLVLLSFFNNPASDDFDYSYESQTEAFWPLQIRRYYQWSGRYFSNGLISLDPLTYHNYFGFKMVPILLLGLFVFSSYFFITALKIAKDVKDKWTYVGLLVFVYIAQMPDICEGFYWIPGSITNQLPTSLTLLFIGSLLRYVQNKNPFYIVVTILLLASILGCNEISVVMFLVIMTGLFLYNSIVLRKSSKVLLVVLLVTIAVSLVELLAPGNAVRAANISIKHQFLFSVFKSIQLATGYVFKWLSLIVICCFFFLDEIKKAIVASQNQHFLIHPIAALGLLFTIVFCGVFPAMWSLNGPPPDRAINTIYFFFVLAAIYLVITVLNYLRSNNSVFFDQLSGFKLSFGLLILLLFLGNEPIVTAYKDLLSGKAYHYNLEMKDRFKRIEACKDTLCVVPPLSNKPKTIYNEVDFSLTTDINNWKNQEVSRYFRKNVIISKPKDTFFAE